MYDRKFLEAQVVRTRSGSLLCSRVQTGFVMGATEAVREYEVDGKRVTERFFVPDGVHGFACEIAGDHGFEVEPEFDLRYVRALLDSTSRYSTELQGDVLLVSNVLPSGTFDDISESFIESEQGHPEQPVFAAVTVIGDDASVFLLPQRRRVRRKLFRKDEQRYRFLASRGALAGDAADHAPLWDKNSAHVFAPASFRFRGHGVVAYGFGDTRDEALSNLQAIRDNLVGLEAQKSESAVALLQHAGFETGNSAVDTAYAQVLLRLTDGLVARNADVTGTALDGPSTMILAGTQYFHDCWKRDENIGLGFLLATGQYELAKHVVSDTWQLQDETTGRLPQRIRAGEEPQYSSSDGTLWALLRLHDYWRCTGDSLLLYEKLPMVLRFFERSIERVWTGLLPSGRMSAHDYLWETWMDTPHTPRHGFPVEIQLLWIAALRAFRPVIQSVDPDLQRRMEEAEASAWQALGRFLSRGMPADGLDEDGALRDLITPNPYFCFGLGLDLGHEIEDVMLRVGRQQLAGKQGIVTLAPEDWAAVFPSEFLTDRSAVRGRRMRSVGKFNYHRGVEWNWLAQFFAQAELKYGEPDVAFGTYVRSQAHAALQRGGIGGISELFDLGGSRGPDYQTWSMSGFLVALHAFLGVQIDVPGQSIRVEPQLPASFPRLQARKWYGNVPFDLRVEQRGMIQDVDITFPWGEPPPAILGVRFVLPAPLTSDRIDLLVDGVPHIAVPRSEPVGRSQKSRVAVDIRAAQHIKLSLTARRASCRSGAMRAG